MDKLIEEYFKDTYSKYADVFVSYDIMDNGNYMCKYLYKDIIALTIVTKGDFGNWLGHRRSNIIDDIINK